MKTLYNIKIMQSRFCLHAGHFLIFAACSPRARIVKPRSNEAQVSIVMASNCEASTVYEYLYSTKSHTRIYTHAYIHAEALTSAII